MNVNPVRGLAASGIAAIAISGLLTASSTLASTGPADASAVGPSTELAKTQAIGGYDNSVVLVGTSVRTMALDVPAGSYSINAKATATWSSGSSSKVGCRLTAGSGFDESDATVTSSNRDQTMALQLVDVLSGPGTVRLICSNSVSTTQTELTFVKITALRVQSATVSELDIS